jgi:hypothetical protein
VVAIFFPRRLAMAWKVAVNCGERLAVCAASHKTNRSHAEPCLSVHPAGVNQRDGPWAMPQLGRPVPGPGCCLVLDRTAWVTGRPQAGRAATRSALEPGRPIRHDEAAGHGKWRSRDGPPFKSWPVRLAPRVERPGLSRCTAAACRRRHDGDRVPPGQGAAAQSWMAVRAMRARPRQAAGLREPAAGHQLSGRCRGLPGLRSRSGDRLQGVLA